MQEVRIYDSLSVAKTEMEKMIRIGWRVHTCTMTSERPSYFTFYHILVVYEKEN